MKKLGAPRSDFERPKECHCYKCDKDFHSLGIMSHRAMHRRKREDCTIMYTNGDTFAYLFSRNASSQKANTDQEAR